MIMKIELAVNGTLMRGLELNHNLLELGGVFVEETLTAPLYRLWFGRLTISILQCNVAQAVSKYPWKYGT